jgi:hypothetical protein
MGTFNTITRWSKFWILGTLFSLTLYDVNWVIKVYDWIYVRVATNPPDLLALYPNFYIDHVAGAIADTLRVIAVILLFVAAFLAWTPKKPAFTRVKKYIATAIFLEAIYWLAILPYNIQNVARGRVPQLLFVGFLIEILAIAPLLIVLSTKVWRYKQEDRNNLLKWGCIAGIGYIFGMWANNIFRWFSMSGIFGAADPRTAVNLFSGITLFGFLNTAVTLTLSLVIAMAGSYLLIKGSNLKRATQLIGIAILLFGLHFALYVTYCWFAPGAWAFVLLTEIWPIPLLGLGIGMLRGKI